MGLAEDICRRCGKNFVNDPECRVPGEPPACPDCEAVLWYSERERMAREDGMVLCAWCTEALLPEDREWAIRHETGQIDYMCSPRCDTKHRAYVRQCVCGWWHSNNHCPRCGSAEFRREPLTPDGLAAENGGTHE